MQHLLVDVTSTTPLPNARAMLFEPTASVRGRLLDVADYDPFYLAECLMDLRGTEGVYIADQDGRSVGVDTRGDGRRRREFLDDLCAACGARSDLVSDADVDVAFCRACLDHTRRPGAFLDEMYYAIGGEG